MDLPKTEKKYWASLNHYHEDPEFMEKAQKEFLSSPLQEGQEEPKEGWDRRDFMKLMAASTALASSACFQRPMHKILPYVNQPEEITFGEANFYASTCQECSTGCGTLVKTREGRPIKLEGNPDHPMNRGGLCARGQASILNLYDPDRLKGPVTVTRGSMNTTAASWEEIDSQISQKLRQIKNGSGKIRVLTETINSPSTLKIINDFLNGFAHGEHVVFDPISAENIIEAQEQSYGARVLPRYVFEKAKAIVSIDADFLGTWLSPVEFTKHFTKNRKLKDGKSLSKLITFESAVTITGSNADVRVPIRSQDGASIALALAHELASKHGLSVDGETLESLKKYSIANVAQATGVSAEALKATAEVLSKNQGQSLIVGGSPQSQNQNGLALQVAINILNSMLKNDGQTVDSSLSPSLQKAGKFSNMAKLIKDMKEGEVDALFIYKSNPIYHLPNSLGFADAARKVGLVVSFNDRADESTVVSHYICPDNHPLENWGDAQPQKNLYSLVQPTIRPIYNTRAFQDSLLVFNKKAALGLGKLSASKDWHEYVQGHWRETIYKSSSMIVPFELFWESSLRDGVFDAGKNRNSASSSRTPKAQALKSNLPIDTKNEGMELVFYPQVAMMEGHNANNPWLQELPDPITRVTWDNYASVGYNVAQKLGLKDGDVVRVKTADTAMDLPALIQPGQHDGVVAVALGYGRESVGAVGKSIGHNMFKQAKAGKEIYFSGMAAQVSKTGAKYTLASVQEHHSMEGRPIVKEASLKDFIENPHAGNEHHETLTTLWSGHEYKGYRWGMAIDLNSCTGCQACVVACQSENNVPVVGKDGVFRGRIMHWLRIDRYYTGTPDNPDIVHQPMLCQHCENAPCETVCPVIATVHSEEGLNQQIYNRCVGTRYCANNCPYKVRRFNWFDYNYSGQMRYPLTLSQNPEVTVRSRGVMEKCTFCIQRIQEAKNVAANMDRKVADGEVKTACQQSCPGDAIVFGNINDSTHEVVQMAKSPRGYHVLEELNVRPSITYLTKIRNAEPKS